MAKKAEPKKENFEAFYDKKHMYFMFIPLLFFILSIVSISNTISEDGTPIYRDVSLKGGLSAIVNVDTELGSNDLIEILRGKAVDNTFAINELTAEGEKVGFIIDTDMEEEKFIELIEEEFGVDFIFGENYSSNFISPTLSSAFFTQAIYILVISFVLMSVVIFAYFRAFVPSMAVVLSAIFDIVVTIGVLNWMGFHISIAGVGALLMIVGYSIDTDVLLTNRVYKEKGFDYYEKTFFAFKTGLLMTTTTLIAGISAIILTNSEVIAEIAIILVVGLLVDFISTWFMNASILYRWVSKK